MTPDATIVVDANLAAKALLPGAPLGDQILKQVANWHMQRKRLIAPDIWLPEVVSVVRQAVYLKLITPEDGLVAVDNLFHLGVEVVPSELELCQRALTWAERLGQSKAYDGFYLALAEQTQGELWTGDRRLINRAQQIGINFIRSISKLLDI